MASYTGKFQLNRTNGDSFVIEGFDLLEGGVVFYEDERVPGMVWLSPNEWTAVVDLSKVV